MNETSTLTFDGVRISQNFLTGMILSNEITSNYRKEWVPFYQRDRINNKAKINSLIEIFQSGRIIDSIKLSVRGEFITDEKTGQAVVSGQISIIDGLQRTLALLDSGVDQLKIPVELYMNIGVEEEIALFHQFNRKGTPLRFGDIIKSVDGPYSNEIRNILEDESYPVPVWSASSWKKLPVTMLGALLHIVHRHSVDEIEIANPYSGRRLLEFLSHGPHESHVERTSRRLRNILTFLVSTFGDYKSSGHAYSKNMLICLTRLIEVNFMNDADEVDVRGFRGKFENMQSRLFNDSAFRAINVAALSAIPYSYRAIIDYMNKGVMEQNLIPEPRTRYESGERYYRSENAKAVLSKE